MTGAFRSFTSAPSAIRPIWTVWYTARLRSWRLQACGSGTGPVGAPGGVGVIMFGGGIVAGGIGTEGAGVGTGVGVIGTGTIGAGS